MNGPLSSLAALMLLASCGTSPATPRAAAAATVGEPFTLAPAQTAQVEGTGLAVTFESVSADSRCPADVTCVWEGDAVVLVTVRPAASTPSELHTSGRYASQVEAGDFRVRLVELKPVPRSGASPAPGEYRATLVVTRK
jgi:hypothetical protein